MEARRSNLRTQVEALNDQYAAWVKTELEERKLELWIDGTQQYISHAQKLLEEFKEAEKSPPSSGGVQAKRSSGFTLNGSSKENGPSKEGQPFGLSANPSVPFAWGKEQKPDSNKPPIPAFLQQNFGSGQNKGAAPFSFGQAAHTKGEKRKGSEEEAANGEDSKPDEAAAKKPLLEFKFPSTSAPLSFGTPNAAPAFSGFGTKPAAPSFAGFNSFSSLAKEDEGKSADEAEEQQEEENQDPIARQDDGSAEVVFETKASLYIQSSEAAGKVWTNKGKGTLTLRKPKDSPGRPFMVLASDTGQILLNASIHEGLKPVEAPRNRVMMTLFWTDEGSDSVKGHVVATVLRSPEIVKDFTARIATLAGQ